MKSALVETAMTVFCANCQHCEQPSASAPWYRYTCLLAPKQVPRQFVVEDPWLTESPHHSCHRMNPEGNCELFEPKGEDNGN